MKAFRARTSKNFEFKRVTQARFAIAVVLLVIVVVALDAIGGFGYDHWNSVETTPVANQPDTIVPE